MFDCFRCFENQFEKNYKMLACCQIYFISVHNNITIKKIWSREDPSTLRQIVKLKLEEPCRNLKKLAAIIACMRGHSCKTLPGSVLFIEDRIKVIFPKKFKIICLHGMCCERMPTQQQPKSRFPKQPACSVSAHPCSMKPAHCPTGVKQ